MKHAKKFLAVALALAMLVSVSAVALSAWGAEPGGKTTKTVCYPKNPNQVGDYDNSWYKDLTVYQIWCRSFKDSDGDGIGDLEGVYQELDYLKDLGVDCIWFSPIYPSPQKDFGYDIADYYDINPEYGDLATFQKVLNGAHERGMKVIMDLVINHTSDENEWFKESRKSRDNPYHDWYFWRDGKNGKNPNNWNSLFEGKAWKYDENLDQYYLHIFAEGQPDLNMDNPAVRNEVKKIMRYWLDMGVDGFREDVITYISKDEGLPDGIPIPVAAGMEHYDRGPNLQKYLTEFQRDVYDHYNMFTVGEGPMTGVKDAIKYATGPDKVLDMMISFEHVSADCIATDWIKIPFSLPRMKKSFREWQEGLYGKGWNCLYLENHDHARIISRYGDENYWKESGKMLCTTYMCLTGTPFIYQGQEIGMLNNHLSSLEECKDVLTYNNYKLAGKIGLSEKQFMNLSNKVSRENARTPVQWDSSANGGFTTGTPWFGVNDNYSWLNVAVEQQDPDPILNFYKKAVKTRKQYPALSKGSYTEYYPNDKNIYCYEKDYNGQKALVICSYANKDLSFKAPSGFDLTQGNMVLGNYKDAPARSSGCTLRPYESRVYIF